VFQVFFLEMQAKREVLFNLNDNKTSRTPIRLAIVASVCRTECFQCSDSMVRVKKGLFPQ